MPLRQQQSFQFFGIAIIVTLLSTNIAPAQEFPTPAEHVQAHRDQQEALLEQTKSLRRSIDQGIETLWETDKLEDHRITISYWGSSLNTLGLFDEYHALHEKAWATNNRHFKAAVPAHSFAQRDAMLAMGQYDEVVSKFSKSTSMGSQLYSVLSHAIVHRDFDTAEKLITDEMRNKPEKGYAGLTRQALIVGNARLAMAAYLVDEKQRVDPALQRLRAVIQDQSQLSDTPIDQEIDWITPTTSFSDYFVMTLAASGHTDLAEQLWKSKFQLTNEEVDPIRLTTRSFIGNFTTDDLCARMAFAGHGDQALRFAREIHGEKIPAKIWHALCLRAFIDGDDGDAKQHADQYFAAIKSFNFAYNQLRENKDRPLSEPAFNVYKLGSAARTLSLFIDDMRQLKQTETAQQAAQLYAELARRYQSTVQHELGLADAKALRVRNANGYPFDLGVLVNLLSDEDFAEFEAAQRAYLRKRGDDVHFQARHWRGADLDEHNVNACLAGIDPEDIDLRKLRNNLQQQVIRNLQAAGKHEQALAAFRVLVEEVKSRDSISYVSGSYGGRVVNAATQHRYVAVQLAAELDQVATGVEILELIDLAGARIDGYRVLAESLTNATDAETALAWADTLGNPDYRLAAQLGVLRAQLQPLLEKEPTPIRQRLDLIERYGSLFLMWGC